jgi:hypothetical protein
MVLLFVMGSMGAMIPLSTSDGKKAQWHMMQKLTTVLAIGDGYR